MVARRADSVGGDPFPTTVYLNGKFVAQPTTGVQRVARCLVGALDALLSEQPDHCRWVLLCPPGHDIPAFRAIVVEVVGSTTFGLHAWEQVALPRAAADGLLVNLAGSAPARARRQVCTFHDAAVFDMPETFSWRFRLWYRWLFRRLAGRAVAIVTVSTFSQQRLSHHLRVPQARIVVIPNGGDHLRAVAVDPSCLASSGLTADSFFLAVGSDSPHKNLARVIAALGRTDPPQARLAIAGGGRGAVFAASTASTRRTGDERVVRLGQIGDAPLKALYSSAIALVFPSLYEGFGLPPLEAMDCGCPVIASRSGALAETCADAALFVDPRDPRSIAEAMERISADPALRRDLIARGHAQAARRTWRSAAEKLRAVVSAHAGAVV